VFDPPLASDVMTLLSQLLVGLVVVPTTLWSALAIHYHFRPVWLRWVASAVPLVGVGASVAFLPLIPWALIAWGALLLVALAWWCSLRPRADRDWTSGMEVLPRAAVEGETLRIKQFRNFDYTPEGQAIKRYEERTYDLTKLSSLDYFLTHWSGPVMAHTLVSFGFDDGQFLCVSVEARRERWQSYSPLWGIFRAYQLMFVVGDERDIVRVRTNVYKNRVYAYRLKLTPEHLRRLLLDYVVRMEALAEQPAWYNSVSSNCTTSLFYRGQGHAKVPWTMKPGIVFNGFSAHTLYRLGSSAIACPSRSCRPAATSAHAPSPPATPPIIHSKFAPCPASICRMSASLRAAPSMARCGSRTRQHPTL
jgi:hypothetical protein